MQVAIASMGCFEFRHACAIADEERLVVVRRVDVFVSEFLEETSITVVGFGFDDAEVPDGIIRDVTVDMVVHFTFAQFAQEGASDESMAIGTIIDHVRIDLPTFAIVAFAFCGREAVFELMPVLVVELAVRSGEESSTVNFVGRDLFDDRYIIHYTADRRDAVSSLRGVAVFRKAVQR